MDLPPLLVSMAFRETKAEAHSDTQREMLNNLGWKGPLQVPNLTLCSKPLQGEVKQK